jgi:hypothetical protein
LRLSFELRLEMAVRGLFSLPVKVSPRGCARGKPAKDRRGRLPPERGRTGWPKRWPRGPAPLEDQRVERGKRAGRANRAGTEARLGGRASKVKAGPATVLAGRPPRSARREPGGWGEASHVGRAVLPSTASTALPEAPLGAGPSARLGINGTNEPMLRRYHEVSWMQVVAPVNIFSGEDWV